MNNNSEKFEVSQIVFSSVVLHGIGVNTTHETALQDCPALWEKFIQLFQLNNSSEDGFTNSYGVSIMTCSDPTQFYYFAGVEELPSGADIKDFTTLDIPGGQYAVCMVPSLQQLSKVFSFLYEGLWLPAGADYQIDMQQPCFEYYTPAYLNDGSFYIYVPLKSE